MKVEKHRNASFASKASSGKKNAKFAIKSAKSDNKKELAKSAPVSEPKKREIKASAKIEAGNKDFDTLMSNLEEVGIKKGKEVKIEPASDISETKKKRVKNI